MHRLLPLALLALAACGDDTRLAAGTWQGGLTPMNHPEMVTPLTYDVAYEGNAPTLTIHGPDGGALPTRHLALTGDTLRFVFDEPDAGLPLRCALARQPDASFTGRCTDPGGQWAHFTMTPPEA